MISRRTVLSLMAFAAVAGAWPALAAEQRAFEWDIFNAAAKAGRPILIEVSAVWCPTCHRQKPIIAELLQQPEFEDLIVLEIDFDARKDVLKEFGVRQQATLIAYKGMTEVGRAVGITRRAAIFELAGRAL
jgi:thiol-disulfide isomerase/thioredoxin